LIVSVLLFVGGGAEAVNRVGETLRVPSEYRSIRAALRAAQSGDEIRIAPRENPYVERIVIDSGLFRSLRLVGEVIDGEYPIIANQGEERGVIEIHNEANLPVEITIQNLIIDGLGYKAWYGVKLFNSPSPDRDQVYNQLTIEDCIIGRCVFGIEVGERSGTEGCSGQWGAADRTKLTYSRSLVEIRRNIVYDMAKDGINFYRVEGELSGNLIFRNGDEGCHTTDARHLLVQHNIFTDNGHMNLHFQLGEACMAANNLIARCQRAKKGYGGYGVVVGGTFSDEMVRIENNVIEENLAAGIRVQPTEVRIDAVSCIPVIAKVAVRNNIIFSNAQAEPDSAGLDHEVYFQRRELPGMRLLLEHNLLKSSEKAVYGMSLPASNLINAEQAFVVEPDSAEFAAVASIDDAWEVMRGYELSDLSAAIDGGDPAPLFDDLPGGLSKGEARNDIGLFGGPRAVWPFLEQTDQRLRRLGRRIDDRAKSRYLGRRARSEAKR
jgi:hypothetical protein